MAVRPVPLEAFYVAEDYHHDYAARNPDQPYIHAPDKTVAQALKEAEGQVGGPIQVKGFVRYALGEGIDKPAAN